MYEDCKNVFLIGLNDFNRKKLGRLRNAAAYRFHGLLTEEEVINLPYYDAAGLVAKASRQLESLGDRIDGIIGYLDFPVSTMVPLLCRRFGLPSASLESMLRCEHKYWSRLEQKRAVPEATPRFTKFNPFDDDDINNIELSYPYWVKPVKSFGSHLGFRITGREVLPQAVKAIRQNLRSLAQPFNYFLEQAVLPDEIVGVNGHYCLAEEIISAGEQCTLEGYVFEGEVNIHGVVDSIRYPGSSVFSYYRYPSSLPGAIRQRMADITRRFLSHIDYNQAAFNIEFFWDQKRDRVSLLEINPRIAQHHSELFEKVDGVSNHQVAVQTATGERPTFLHGRGTFAIAGVYFIRRFEDALVIRVPSEADIRAAEEAIPGTVIKLEVREGTRLSELYEQDSYSYILGLVYVGGRNPGELSRKYRQCLDRLPFEFE